MQIADFEFTERLYEGRSTVVYAGVRTGDRLAVVAKLVPDGGRDLQREHDLLQRAAGAGVVDTLGIFESSEGPVLVQRRFGDGTVLSLCQHGPAPLAAALQIGVQLTHVLARLHRARILHRDIKPANLLYERTSARIALADFGIAVELPINARSITVHDLVGTPAYIAPEQTGRLRQGCDVRSDLYATGITLYQLLTGELPFETEDLLEQLAAQLSKTPVAPDQLNPAVPKQLSAIVMKAMEKLPERRYQSAKGMGADLARCLAAIEAGEPEPDFELGLSDVFLPKFPSELYGRSAALMSLRAAQQAAAAGRPRLLVLCGRAGSGRSQLLQALLAGSGELQYALGRWDEQNQRPLSAITQALAAVAERWLSLDDAALATLRARALPALGHVGQALVELAPELGSVLGPQPELPALGPAQARARLRHVFRSFFAAIGGQEGSLLVLENAEHADPASLDLLEGLLSASDKTPVLVLLTVTAPDQLAELRERYAGDLVELGPLSRLDVDAWTAATLQLPAAEVRALAGVLYEKSAGNPGMLVRLIEHFVDTGLVDRESGRYRWDLAQLRAANPPQNVGALLAERVSELSEPQRAVLAALSCHELPAEISNLAAMLGESSERTARLLPALQAEGLVTLKAERYSIAHPGVARAVAESCSAERRTQLARRLARHLLQTRDDAQLAAQAYLSARALEQAELPLEGADRTRAARLYKEAGAQASGAMAYDRALRFQAQGLALLGASPAPAERGLWLELTVAHARGLMMLKQNERCEELLSQLCTHELSPEEIALVYQSRIDNMSNIMQRERAVQIGLEGLARLGIQLPDNPPPQEPFALLQQNEQRLMQLSQDDIVHYREISDPTAAAAIRILSSLMAPTGLTGRTLLWVLEAEVALRLILDHGRERYTTSFLVAHAMMLLGVLKNFAAARRWYATCLALEAASPAPEIGARTYMVMGYYLAAWFEPPAAAITCLEKGVALGSEAGDPLFAALCASAQVTVSMLGGVPLERVLQLVEAHSAILQGDGGAWANASNVRNLCQKLTRGDAIEAEDLAQISGVPLSAGAMRNNAMVNFGLALSAVGCESQVRAWLSEIGPGFPLVNAGQPHIATLRLLEGLFAAKDAQAGAPERLEVTKKALEELRLFESQTGASHHRAAILLLEAELARASGDADLAAGRYGRAAATAQRLEQTQLLALAHERRSELLRAEHMEAEAALHLREAYVAYKRWGNMTKAHQLESAHPELGALSSTGVFSSRGRSTTAAHTMTAVASQTGSAINDALDLATVLRVSQEISSELQAGNVVNKVLSGIVQNAGAERALWLTLLAGGRGGERAFAEVAGGSYRSLDVPLSAYRELPDSVVRVVRRTGLPLVVADALNDPAHKHDPFVVAQRCRSIAIIPLTRKGALAGLVLLENRLVAGAFTPQLISLTSALVAQAAISLDNASLYEDMEERVRERTQALNQRNEQMRLVLDNVSEGLFVVDRAGKLASERSAMLERFFPEGVPERLHSFFEPDARVAQSFALNWEQLFDGVLPIELCIHQLPHAFTRADRAYELAWQPLCDERAELRALLVVMRDITEARRREHAEQLQKQLLVIFERILADQHGVNAFLQESDRLLAELQADHARPEVEKRLLHTLKGNTAIFGLSSFSQLCHELESVLELEERRPSAAERAQLQQAWRDTRAGFERFLDAQSGSLLVPLDDYQAALARLRDDHHSLAGDLELWQLESARARFERIAEQAHKLAMRLGKAPIRVHIEDGGVYFVEEVWTPFWAAFVHVLRNALDHGIEPPAERAALGKEAGTLTLRARLEESVCVLEIGDDGRGIAWERLRTKARAAGLPAETHDDLLTALFEDGVTTKDVASEMSGRGVGLAAVREACIQLNARIEVESSSGQGTTWRFRFPAQLVRTRGSAAQHVRKSA